MSKWVSNGMIEWVFLQSNIINKYCMVGHGDCPRGTNGPIVFLHFTQYNPTIKLSDMSLAWCIVYKGCMWLLRESSRFHCQIGHRASISLDYLSPKGSLPIYSGLQKSTIWGPYIGCIFLGVRYTFQHSIPKVILVSNKALDPLKPTGPHCPLSLVTSLM